jgi:hypothetical protein
MNIELTLLELNELYYILSKGVEKHKELVEMAKEDTPELKGYFDRELHKSIQLLDKIHKALIDECNKLDEARDYVLSMVEAQSEDRRLGNI